MKHNKITRLGMLVAEFGFIELLLLANPRSTKCITISHIFGGIGGGGRGGVAGGWGAGLTTCIEALLLFK